MWYNEGKKEYKFIAALDCDKEELKKLCWGDKIMEKFEKKVNDLNEDVLFTEFMDAETEARLLKNTLNAIAKEEKATQIAKNMLNKNMDLKLIVELTGLTKEEIESLK